MHVLRPFGELFPEYGIPFPIKIIPGETAREIYQGVLAELGVEEPRDLPSIDINCYRSLAIQGLSTITKPTTPLIKKAAKLYEERLFKTPYLDFTSIINISAQMIHEQEYVRKTLQSKFPWLLIDEYQDLGKALHEMVLELLYNAGIKIYAVGDMNQSIYGFNGGYPEFLEELLEKDDIKGIRLDANYRSTQHIIDASMETLLPAPPIPKYFAQARKDEAADFAFITCEEELEPQYDITVKKVIPYLLKNGLTYNEIAVIAAANSHVKRLSEHLKNAGIPFYVAKWDFENSNLVVWLQDCAEWCINPSSQSFDDIFRTWYNLLLQHSDERALWERIRLKVLFYKILTRAKAMPIMLDWLTYLIDELQLKKTLKDSEQFPNEVENLDILTDEAKLHNLKGASLERFAKLGFPDNEVTITTRHSVKGLEFESVVLLGMEEGNFPNYRYANNSPQMEEEQRLCYVCVSRAKKTCVLIRSKFYTIPTRDGRLWRKESQASRFWLALHHRFGDKKNTFDDKDFPG
nr:DNA helicase-2/ATP-dependent DNA helicase PcrA [Mucilaginibacter sp. E4BP6]